MTTSDYLINGLLVLLVLRQIRGRRLAGWALYMPLAIVAYVATQYLHGIPTGGDDLYVIVGASALGLTLGTLCAGFTHVYPDHDGVPFAKAGMAAASLWVLGVGARLAFSLYASHGGGASILNFDHAHDITTIQTWASALILMAILEAVGRTAVLVVRGHRLPGHESTLSAPGAQLSLSGIMGGREV